MKYDDLTPRQKAAVDAKLDTPRKRRTTQRTGLSGRVPTVCYCGARFGSEAAWGRHSGESGCRRTVCIGSLATGELA